MERSAISTGTTASTAVRWPSGRRRRFARLSDDGCRTLFGHTGGPTPGRCQCALGAHVQADGRCVSAERGSTAWTLPAAMQSTTIAVHHWRTFVDDQITVRLPSPLGRTLRRTSRRLGRRPSDVVRMALEAFLRGAPSADGKRAERVAHLIGSLASEVPDLAERHREYVLAALKHGG